MAQQDGYPAADALTGQEVFALKQGGTTKSVTAAQIATLAQSGLLPLVEQMIADAIAGLAPAPATPRLISDAGSLLADDAGGHLLAG